MKKFFAFLLTFAMLFSLAMPAMAADVNGNTTGDVTASYNPTYSITVNTATNGSVSADKETAVENETITLTVSPDEGYELDQLTVKDASNNDVTVASGYTFNMPASNVTVTATFKELVDTTYAINIGENIANGTVVSDKAEAKKDDSVTLTVTPDTGYELETLTVGGSDVTTQVQDGKYTFTMGEATVEVNATFKKINYTIAIDTNIVNGTVTAPATATYGDSVTLTVSPSAKYELGSLTVTDAGGNPVTVTDKTFVMPASDVTVTATFNALSVTSVSISWGNMSFTYDDTVDATTGEENGWTCAEKANTITVENTGDTAIKASAAYTATATDYGVITGSLGYAQFIASSNSGTFTLTLSGKPTKAIPAGTKIGEVTITIEPALYITISEAADEDELDIMLESLATALNSGVTEIAIDMGEKYRLGDEEESPFSICFAQEISAAIMNSTASEGSVNLTLNGTCAGYVAHSFLNNTKLKTVSLPDATLVASSLFLNCTNLTAVYAPNATSIGATIFSGCNSLTTVELTAAGTFDIFDGTWSDAFGCETSNVNLVLNADKMSSVTINDDGTATWNGMTFKSIDFVD